MKMGPRLKRVDTSLMGMYLAQYKYKEIEVVESQILSRTSLKTA